MRCLVIDDDPNDRELVERMVSRAGHQAHTVGDAEAGISLARSESFDCALVDLGMPGLDGVQTIRRLRKDNPDLRLLVVSGFDDREHVLDAVSAGADGYILKTEVTERLPLALEELMQGGGPMSARIARFILEEMRKTDTVVESDHAAPPKALSKREWDVLQGLSRGYTYAEIANSLQISVNTVRHHIRNLYGKLDVSGKAEAVSRALSRHPHEARDVGRDPRDQASRGPADDKGVADAVDAPPVGGSNGTSN